MANITVLEHLTRRYGRTFLFDVKQMRDDGHGRMAIADHFGIDRGNFSRIYHLFFRDVCTVKQEALDALGVLNAIEQRNITSHRITRGSIELAPNPGRQYA